MGFTSQKFQGGTIITIVIATPIICIYRRGLILFIALPIIKAKISVMIKRQ